eukprot:CAMPEP_0202900710 /NCGR_PEP_ID=MMETSP1392-20130828/11994_1 /ASSEMBLY_ACC=CAM_ASM_000868 /TAXON_ID=225041 /ORGANISM="Chlamydomonas chlamydogama, Strain SAG 11-48b" /LENGTH=131 /DNA_ID=CAMNT_0049587151 /DNA_START=214 /DNA_END=609 /DNA_ORIENTATION=-
MRRPVALLGTILGLVLCVNGARVLPTTQSAASSIASETAKIGSRRAVFEGILQVLSVDYMNPPRSETWYSLYVPSSQQHLQLAFAPAVTPASELISGKNVRVFGALRTQHVPDTLVNHTPIVDVMDIQILP